MWPFKKKEDYQVYFTTDEWAIRKYAPVQPAKNFTPDAFKHMETYVVKNKHPIDSLKSIKTCPGIVDYCNAGYVIPAWCDIEMIPTPDCNYVEVRYSHPRWKQGSHPPRVIQNFMSEKFKVRMSVKLDNPWLTWTSDGYSLLWLPMYYYDDSRNWEAIPGWIDQDLGPIQTPINIMLKNPIPTVIKMGEPLVQLIPIKRDTTKAFVGDTTHESVKRHNGISYLHDMTFTGWGKWIRGKKPYIVDINDTELPKKP